MEVAGKCEVHPWNWPEKPRERIHTDFMGPYKGYNFLVIIDAKTKWLEVFLIKLTTASKIIEVLHEVFSRFGLPLQIVSDNGPQYISSEFSKFLKKLGVRQTFSAIKHSASNGAAENFIKTFKRKLKILLKNNVDVQKAIDVILLEYRTTKHNTTGEMPAKLMLNREVRTKFDLLRSNVQNKHNLEKNRQVRSRKRKRKVSFEEKEKVLAGKYSVNAPSWSEAIIENKLRPVTYKIKFQSGVTTKRHVNQLMKYVNKTE